MQPREVTEIESVAAVLLAHGMRSTAARLLALVGPAPDDERPCRVQDGAGQITAIPWGLAEILYPAYGSSQTLERLHERGGFGRMELGQLATDCYHAPSEDRIRPRLARMPLLQLYDLARRS